MRKDEHKTHESKGVYRVRNWSAYHAGPTGRGDVTMWIDKSVLKQDTEVESRKRGRPCIYSDSVIQIAARAQAGVSSAAARASGLRA